jgi:hypothetical protein
MVGVINANASTSISTQISLAREASYQLIPGEPFPNEAQQASMESLAHTATTATLTVTETPAHSSAAYPDGDDDDDNGHHGSAGLSDGAIAGIAVGAAIAGIGAAALFFLLCRTRSLKKQLDQQQQQQQQQPPTTQLPPNSPFSPAYAHYHDQSRHTSSLPPYQGLALGQERKPEDVASERSSSPMQTPYQMPGQHFAPFQPGVTDPRFTQ